MLVPDTCTAGTLAKQSDAFLVLGSLYKKRKNYTFRLEVLRCKGPMNNADHLAVASALRRVVFPSLKFNYCKRAQVPPASTAQQCWMLFSSKSGATAFVLLLLTIVIQQLSLNAIKFDQYARRREYKCVWFRYKSLFRSTSTTKVITWAWNS